MTNKRHLRNDIILLCVVFVVVVIAACLLFMRDKGNSVEVSVDGKLYAVYPLSVDLSEDILTGSNKTQLNRLVIKDGKAHVEKATCRDGICSAHKEIYRDGESIVCLPHRVVITVVTTDSATHDISA